MGSVGEGRGVSSRILLVFQLPKFTERLMKAGTGGYGAETRRVVNITSYLATVSSLIYALN